MQLGARGNLYEEVNAVVEDEPFIAEVLNFYLPVLIDRSNSCARVRKRVVSFLIRN